MAGKYPTPRGKAATAAKKKYNSENYERLFVTVGKGEKEKIKSAASAAGESVNGYIKRAIEMRMAAEKTDIGNPISTTAAEKEREP